MFKPVVLPPAPRLPSAIARQLEHLIVEGRLMPGEGLPSERELAKRIGVSRPSLREALSELRSRGLIEPTRNGGSVVTELTKTSLTEPLSQMLERHPAAMKDLIEMRGVLEAHAAFLAAVQASAADLQKIDLALNAQIESPFKNVVTLAKRDLDFHLAVAQASHNVALLHTTHGLSRLIKVFVQRGYEIILATENALAGKAAVEEQHRAIFRAIAARDPDAARDAALAHLRSTENVWAVPTQSRPASAKAPRPRNARVPARRSA
jgi:GntR family transcriptional regulator, transcriptional repressor for pyruvate dehydrogenase complex